RDGIARDVHGLAVHLDMAMANELTRSLAACGETHAVHHVIQPTLKCREKVVAGDPRQLGDLLERVAELLLAHAVNALDLLLFTELLGVLRRLAATGGVLSVLTRSV